MKATDRNDEGHLRPETRVVHAGWRPAAGESLAPPLVQASAQVFDSLDDYDDVAAGRRPGHLYGRNSNENVASLEAAVADLEGATAAVATASGMAAILCTVLALASRPRPLVVDRDAYGVSLALLRSDLEPLGYEIREVDLADEDALKAALPGAAVVICETVTNPLARVNDVQRISALASTEGSAVVVDNTYATPLLCRPLAWGATAVVHSVTKYLAGHSDLIAGVVCAEQQLIEAVRQRVIRTGGSLGPFEGWRCAACAHWPCGCLDRAPMPCVWPRGSRSCPKWSESGTLHSQPRLARRSARDCCPMALAACSPSTWPVEGLPCRRCWIASGWCVSQPASVASRPPSPIRRWPPTVPFRSRNR